MKRASLAHLSTPRMPRKVDPHTCRSPAVVLSFDSASSKTTLLHHAQAPVRLVPISLALELDGIKLDDAFLWNTAEQLVTPEHFAQLFIDDFDNVYPRHFVPLIAQSIRAQLSALEPAAVEELLPPSPTPSPAVLPPLDTPPGGPLEVAAASLASSASSPPPPPTSSSSAPPPPPARPTTTDAGAASLPPSDPGMKSEPRDAATATAVAAPTSPPPPTATALPAPFAAVPPPSTPLDDGERAIIRLNLHVGTLHLRDQFEWPLSPAAEGAITPECFAAMLAADVGIAGQFVPAIAVAIREQVAAARLQTGETARAPPLAPHKRPFRGEAVETEWQPDVRELDEESLARLAKERDRQGRRLRRGQRGAGYALAGYGGGAGGAGGGGYGLNARSLYGGIEGRRSSGFTGSYRY
ncbi:hypothetical protein CXG81DRAFT_19913 [Caulochytrium protostelioides]|uniref:SNF5-domain-containing protein n=1 Tax=Caulochytrium protostelioides TaxID=1555241 RepID=A0A4P9X4U6_9FUNG|nr:hypothetical protein CXG81DRAFT_19913 [Caulochytrium protostelioides]|eukprot:RKP00085.1 hypothetical protein CXG81DRAFT_19913 [Caulochytrium protostelioides]